MTREELDALLTGKATPASRSRLASALEQPDDTAAGALDEAFAPPSPPDVFDAAFADSLARPTQARWWRGWLVLAAVAAVVLVVLAWPRRAAEDEVTGVKGVVAVPEVSVVWVRLDGVPRRLTVDEVVPAGARLGARVVASRAAWLALEEEREGAWVRAWPTADAGSAVGAGEQEVADDQGAFAWRAEATRLRWVVSAQPLNEAGPRAVVAVTLVVSP
jgi:hypothetical protein